MSNGKLFVGMKIQHRWRHSGAKEFDWFATITEINTSTDEIYVEVTSAQGYTHGENWNKAHTETGLRYREYVEIKDE